MTNRFASNFAASWPLAFVGAIALLSPPSDAANLNLARRGGIDIDGLGRGAIVVRSPMGQMQVGRLAAGNQFQFTPISDPGIKPRMVGVADFDGNGKSDFVYQSLTQVEFGDVSTWLDFSSSRPRQFIRGYWGFVTLALNVNLATDFRRNITIDTRNGSKRIRTFAGDDTIKRALSDPDCTIDGGLGLNSVVYPGRRVDWNITKGIKPISVRPVAGGATDTLTRVQRAVFDDEIVNLTAL